LYKRLFSSSRFYLKKPVIVFFTFFLCIAMYSLPLLEIAGMPGFCVFWGKIKVVKESRQGSAL
jgi:NADH:ubiquinone oxidoreductase subunit 2 (subunit N)